MLVGKRRFCVQVVLSGTSRFPFRLTHFVSFIFISFRLVSVHLFILDRFSFFPSKQITDGIPYLAFFEKTHPSHINFELDQKYASHLKPVLPSVFSMKIYPLVCVSVQRHITYGSSGKGKTQLRLLFPPTLL